MVAEALDISRETYFAILMDRACNGPVMVGSPQGGMDIEEVAATNPELIFKVCWPHRQSFIRKILMRQETTVGFNLFIGGIGYFEMNKARMFATRSMYILASQAKQ